MTTIKHIVIVGTGVAGCWAAMGARQADPDALITLIGEEHYQPYDRTHLSKQMLVPGARLSDSALTESGWFEQNDINLRTGIHVDTIDTATQILRTSLGEDVRYDSLVLATGSFARQLPESMLTIDSERIHTLRVADDAIRLNSVLNRSERIVVIGAGLIGLEVAAAARARRIEVDVLEAAPRILQRSCDDFTADRILHIQQEHGVNFHLGVSIASISNTQSESAVVRLADGRIFEADHIIVGVGVLPNIGLAESAGLKIDNGIAVDAYGRASEPGVYAAGDVASLPLPGHERPVRLETWRHAQDHGRCVGANAAGHPIAYNSPASFWSDQYDHRIQGVGQISDQIETTLVRTYGDGRHVSLLLGRDRQLLAVLGVDTPKDINAMGKLIGRQLSVSDAELLDETQPLVPTVKRILKQAS